jgi:hypothetical protein
MVLAAIIAADGPASGLHATLLVLAPEPEAAEVAAPPSVPASPARAVGCDKQAETARLDQTARHDKAHVGRRIESSSF